MSDPDRMKKLAWLISDPDQIGDIPLEEIPDVVGVIESVKTRLLTRLYGTTTPTAEPDVQCVEDRLLDVREVAERLSVKPKWIYDHADGLPFVKRLSDRTLRCSERGLNRWLERKAS
jgi:predicted DNA-binding transcriptional regulator AlpA